MPQYKISTKTCDQEGTSQQSGCAEGNIDDPKVTYLIISKSLSFERNEVEFVAFFQSTHCKLQHGSSELRVDV